jgi:hypothetical protein
MITSTRTAKTTGEILHFVMAIKSVIVRDKLAANNSRSSAAAAERPITGPYWRSSSVTETHSLAGTGLPEPDSIRAGDYRAGWFLLDDDTVELNDLIGWEPLAHEIDRVWFEATERQTLVAPVLP